VSASVNPDNFIINAVNSVEELQKSINALSKRLREWYSLYLPEADKRINDNEAFVNLVIKKDKHALLREFTVDESAGAELREQDLRPVLSLAKLIHALAQEKQQLEEYLEKTMQEHCPNMLTLTGALIGAKLVRGAGSLKKMALMRSSTIQLLGAEKALFRHIRTGARPPKYGYLMQHVMVQGAKKQDKGKVARALADKIFLAVRVDYFRGEFIGTKLLKELKDKIK